MSEEKYLTVRDVATRLDLSITTIINWDKSSDLAQRSGKPRLIPKPMRIKGNRCWTEADFKAIKEYSGRRCYGTMTGINYKSS
jgi:transposase